MYKTIVIGNLTADPVVNHREWADKNTGEIIRANVCNFSVGANEGYGENRKTQYFKMTAWRGLADICENKLAKGTKVYIEGLPSVNIYTNKSKEVHANLEIRVDRLEILQGSKRIVATEDNVEELDDEMPY